mmetsp:Transcript_50058/g.167274  ORF Transcript_50058/g.167274 Transcript_50058/m.167274 type:complete len:315 (-) Transcript_50058:94-1038(-)
MAATRARMSFSKPMSSMRSASSSTRTRHSASVVHGPSSSSPRKPPLLPLPPLPLPLPLPPPRACIASMSSMRPGVATTMSAPRERCPACTTFGAPPYTTTERAPSGAPKRSACSLIWIASSRVGAMTRQYGCRGPEESSFPRTACQRASAGRRYPSVLPEPVLATARTSRPATAAGQAAPWTADGAVNPGWDSSSSTSGWGKGALARLVTTAGAAVPAPSRVISCAAQKARAASRSALTLCIAALSTPASLAALAFLLFAATPASSASHAAAAAAASFRSSLAAFSSFLAFLAALASALVASNWRLRLGAGSIF